LVDAIQAPWQHRDRAETSPADRLRVIVVAAEGPIRARLVEALREPHSRFELLGTTSAVDDLLVAHEKTDVVLVDAELMQQQRIRAARQAFPAALLIAVVENSKRHRVRGALVDGADGVIVHDALERTLRATVEAARVGQLAIPKEVRSALTRPLLSTREKQVLGMVVLGFTNGEIARKLVLAESTIKSHLSSAFSKLGVRSRSEASALILDTESGLGAGILTIAGDEPAGD
jgi:DNA-binding NarL/FixJ family response regulator